MLFPPFVEGPGKLLRDERRGTIFCLGFGGFPDGGSSPEDMTPTAAAGGVEAPPLAAQRPCSPSLDDDPRFGGARATVAFCDLSPTAARDAPPQPMLRPMETATVVCVLRSSDGG